MNMAAFGRRCGVSRETVRNWVKDGMPKENEDAAAEWVASTYPKYAKALYGEVSTAGAGAPPVDGSALSGLDLVSTLDRFQRLEELAWQDLEAAQELRKEARAGTKQATSLDAAIMRGAKRFKDASTDRLMIEKKVADFELETGRRIPFEIAKELVDETMASLVVLIDALPYQEDRSCNPGDPETARRELQRWVKNVKRQMRGEDEENGL